MSHTPHELSEEFPDAHETLHRLKEESAHFAKLADSYHELNRQIHRSEEKLDPMSDLAEAELRKKRLLLKDEIAALIKAG